jgi:hypothetical protein
MATDEMMYLAGSEMIESRLLELEEDLVGYGPICILKSLQDKPLDLYRQRCLACQRVSRIRISERQVLKMTGSEVEMGRWGKDGEVLNKI